MTAHRYALGEHLFMRIFKNGNTGEFNLVPVKVTALKKQSSDPRSGGEAPKYNVKIVGTKNQRTNVSEISLFQERPPMGGRRGRTVKRRTLKKKRTTRRR